MADWNFDGVNKIIKEPSGGSGDTVHDVQRDIYSAWKRWVRTSGSQYLQALTVEGGTPIGATGLFTGSTFILTNGWKLMSGDWDHQALCVGNIYSDDGVVSAPNPSYAAAIFVSASVAAQGIATGSGVTPADVADIADAVWDETLADHTDAGSTGNALDNVSGGSSPETIAAAVWNYATRSLTTFGSLIANISGPMSTTTLTAGTKDTEIDELHKLQGLKEGSPMTVTPTSRTVDDIDLEITGDGENTTTVTRQP
jgi:hypothetical protein